MAEPLTVKSVYDRLQQYVRKHPDIGVRKAILDGVLEPASPFDSKGARSLKRGFTLLALLAALISACFIYFNGLW